MGKSSKKSATKVEAAPAAVVPVKSGKKGKREAEDDVLSKVNAKKQKIVEKVDQAVKKGKLDAKLPKKKKEETSSSESSDSEEEEKAPVVAKKADAKNGKVVPVKKGKASSSDSSSEEDSSSDDEPAVAPAKKVNAAPVKKVKDSSSDESSSDDSDSDEEIVPAKKVSAPSKNGKKPASSSSSEDDSDSEEETPAAKPKPVAVAKKADSSEDSSDDDDSSDEDVKPAVAKKQPVSSMPAKKEASSDDSSSEDDSSSDDEPAPAKKPVGAKATPAKKDSSSDDSSEEDSDEESDEEPAPKKKDTDVEMVDASPKPTISKSEKKTPNTPATPRAQSTGSCTLFVGNLSFSVERADIEKFFLGVGEVVDVRFATDQEGQFRGFGHVEFATPEAAKKALELHGELLLNREVRLDMANERPPRGDGYTPQSSNGNRSFGQAKTIFVRGFDKFAGQDKIKESLQEIFGECGEITRVSIPTDYETGDVKGICYMDFNDTEAFNKAIELNGADCGGYQLVVEEAKPREPREGGSGGRFDGGGRFSGRGGRGDRGGRFSGRGGRGDSGGRFGGRGGRGDRGGRFGGRGGRGTPASQGKKTKFNDE